MDRPSAAARGYGRKWREARAGWLAKHPLCAMCEEQGIVTRATVVDHVIAHKGDMKVFWDTANWASLCKTHHDSTKQRIEKGRQMTVIGEDGWPA